MSKYLGIEIGGTKLQLGVGTGQSRQLDDLVRVDVDTVRGAEGILERIASRGRLLMDNHKITRIGVGFGGPVDARRGRVITSHQIEGWNDVPLVDRLQATFARPTAVDNDCNVAAMAEAGLGAGQAHRRVFYVTVGTGIGGGFVVDGVLQGQERPAIAEIGHLRPGTDAACASQTVESIASGWGIAATVRAALATAEDRSPAARELRELCDGSAESLTTQQIAAAAKQGNRIAAEAIGDASQVLGWAVAQVVTLLAPEVVVIGGGVSLIGDSFFAAVRQQSARFVFPPLADTYRIVPAALGEEVVVHGALLLAASAG